MTAELSEQLPPAAPATGSQELGLAGFVGEFFVLLGAGATVLLQMAEPGVGHGVADHSIALRRPLNRLRTTMAYVYAVTMGSPEEQQAIARMVNKAHVPVRSATYNAFDPELQLWVSATLYQNGATLRARFFGAADDETGDRIYHQSAVYGTALQVKPEMWPATRAEFDEYWAHKLDTLEAEDQVRDFVYGLMHDGEAPWFIMVLMPLNRFFTAGLTSRRTGLVLGPGPTARLRCVHDGGTAGLPVGARPDPPAALHLLPVGPAQTAAGEAGIPVSLGGLSSSLI